MKSLLLGCSIIFSLIEFTLAQKCFGAECYVDGKSGCKNRIRINVNTGDECCKLGAAVGFAESMKRLGNVPGCYQCDRCVDLVAKRDGNWGSWSSWSACSKTCDRGIRTRNRRCDSPAPSKLGEKCEGINVQRNNCIKKRCPIDGQWGKWSGWSKCSKTCGNGKRFRTRECNEGRKCEGQPKIYENCVLIKNCPIDGGWGYWSAWSKCSKSCGGGVSNQHRSCDNPPPLFEGKMCTGHSKKSVSCNKNPCPIDGQWSAWSTYSACIFDDCNDHSKGGRQMRSRSCNSPRPRYGGKMCTGKMFDKAFCIENDNCARDGEWGPWGIWKCSDTGAYRVRECLYKRFEGKYCLGNNRFNKPMSDLTFCTDCKSNCRLDDDGKLIANSLYYQKNLGKGGKPVDYGRSSGDGSGDGSSGAGAENYAELGDDIEDGYSGSGDYAMNVNSGEGDRTGDGGSGAEAGDDTEKDDDVEDGGSGLAI